MSTKISPAEVIAINATDRLIAQLKDTGSIAPRNKMANGFYEALSIPENLSGYKYQNSNNFALLMLSKMFNPHYGNKWATGKQISDKGGSLKKGQRDKGAQIELNFMRYIDEDGKHQFYPFNDKKRQKEIKAEGLTTYWSRRYKTVYNVRGQTFGMDEKFYPEPIAFDPTDPKVAKESTKKVMDLVKAANLKVVTSTETPNYQPGTLTITMPDAMFFQDGVSAYLSTLLHEYSHGLGDPRYLSYNGSKAAPFGSQQYAHEELRAEITSICLSAQLGLPYTSVAEGHATSYTNSWIKALDDDPMYLMRTIKDVVRTINFSNNLTSKFKPFYDAVEPGMQSHCISMSIAAGADVESTLDNIAAGEPPSFMYLKDFHAATIGSVYSKEMGLPSGFSYHPGLEKEDIEGLNNRYHQFAKGEAVKAIDSIEAAMDVAYENNFKPGA